MQTMLNKAFLGQLYILNAAEAHFEESSGMTAWEHVAEQQ